MRKTNMRIFYLLLLIHFSKVHSSVTPLTTVASEQLSKMKELIKFIREEAALEKRDIEEGVVHLGLADVKSTLLAKIEEVRSTKPECVKDTEAVANGIVSEVGDYVKKCFGQIEEKLESASKMADDARTVHDVDKLVTTVSEFYDNRKTHFTKCTEPAAKVMLARMQKEEEKIDNCVEGIKPTSTTPELTKPEENKPSTTKPKLPSTSIKIIYILHPPMQFPCKPYVPWRPRRRRTYYWWW